MQINVLFAHIVLYQKIVLDVFDDLNLLKLLLFIGVLVLDQALPLSFGLRLFIKVSVVVNLPDVVFPKALSCALLLKVVAKIENALQGHD